MRTARHTAAADMVSRPIPGNPPNSLDGEHDDRGYPSIRSAGGGGTVPFGLGRMQ